MALVVIGRLNKQIAHDIGISEITVKVHRGQVMRKMKAASLPDLASPRSLSPIGRSQRLAKAGGQPVRLRGGSYRTCYRRLLFQ